MFPVLCGCCAHLPVLHRGQCHSALTGKYAQTLVPGTERFPGFPFNLFHLSMLPIPYNHSHSRDGQDYFISWRAGRQKTRPCLKRLDGRPLQNTSSTHSHGSGDNGQAHSALARHQDSKFFSPNDSFGHKDPMFTICSLVSYTSVHLHKSSPVTLQSLYHWPGYLNQAACKSGTQACVDTDKSWCGN